MKQNKKLLLKLLLGVLLLLCSNKMLSQASGIAINWNIEVGCQITDLDYHPDRPKFIEEIGGANCIRVCELSTVTYTLSGALGASPATSWVITGGTMQNHTSTTCTVHWGVPGTGSLGFTVNAANGPVTKTLCMEIMNAPNVDFSCTATLGDPEPGFGQRPEYYACEKQIIYFTNQSDANGSSAINTYLWEFGDGTTSSEQNPSHIYYSSGQFAIFFTVTNLCGCKKTLKMFINIEKDGFDIQCPGVVCEGQTVTYSLPFDGQKLCKGNFNWTIDHNYGTINSVDEISGDVNVTWNHVDTTGFGLLTFIPADCKLGCLLPTTIRVPVIQSHGTITGYHGLCEGEQGLYELPQWPSTDFHWQIDGNPNNPLAELIPNDQRNQIVVKALQSGTVVLRATYENSLLHCGGSAEFTIIIGKPNFIRGDDKLCVNNTGSYTTDNGGEYNWVIKSGNTILAEANNSTGIAYSFQTPGNYTVSISSPTMCTNTSMGVTVYALPTPPGAVTGSTTVCPNAPYQYAITAPDSNSTYNWDVSPAGSATFVGSQVGNAVTIRFNNTATHQVLITRTRNMPANCTSVAEAITVTTDVINAQIATHSGTDNIICDNHVGQYDAVFSSGSNLNTLYNLGENYTWSICDDATIPVPAPTYGSIIVGQGTNSISILWNDVSAVRHAKLRLDIVKCTLPVKTVYFDVNITPGPQIKIVGPNPASACSNATVSFQINDLITNLPLSPGTPVIWDMGDGSFPHTGTPSYQHVFYNGNNTILTRTITASVSGCDGTPISTTFTLQVIPGPSAAISITHGGNAYCQPPIDTILTAATTTGTTIAWYHNSTATASTGTTYAVPDFGAYTIRVTDPITGCRTNANTIFITQLVCNPPQSCSLPDPVVSNDGCTTECHVENNIYTNIDQTVVAIHLAGTVSAPYSYTEGWNIQGPDDSTNVTDPYVQVYKAGQYNVIHSAYYTCNGHSTENDALQVITVPYIPKFNYQITCQNNSTFTVNVIDNTDFFAPVTNKTYTYFIKLSSDPDTAYTQVLQASGEVGDGSFQLSNCNGNTYTIKLVVGGSINNQPMPPCETVLTTTQLNTLPAMNIEVANAPIRCYDTPVKFNVIGGSPSFTYLWTFDNGAQNTQGAPIRVFDSSGSQPVSVVVTNKYGCTTAPALGINLTIPPKCFEGTITATPSSAQVCSPNAVHLEFSPTTQNCQATSYTWMQGTTEIETTNAGTGSNGNGENVYTSGFYWVKVHSSDNCTFETTNRITPVFKTGPSVKLQTEATYCESDNITAAVTTDGTNIQWFLDGVQLSAENGQTSISLAPINAGTHTLQVSADGNGCSNSATQSIAVNPMPDQPQLSSSLLSCEPYQYAVNVDSGSGNYTWSNGMNGNHNIVTNGGPIRVYSTVGGCRNYNDISIPKNPDNYGWSFPSGCYEKCDEAVVGNLMGPNTILDSWSWILDGTIVDSGSSSIPTPYAMTASGTYTFDYTLGTCEHVSQPLNYTLGHCEKCPIDDINVSEKVVNETKYCSYTITFHIYSDYSGPETMTLSSPTDEVMVQPSTFVLQPGNNLYTFTIVPINGYSGGAIQLLFAAVAGDQLCQNLFDTDLPDCKTAPSSKTETAALQDALTMYPNPTHDLVRIAFDSPTPTGTIEVYDMTGRLMSSYAAKTAKGEWELAVGNFASGMYVVVLKSATNDILMQKKLLKE